MKLKTHKALSKKVRITKTGKILRVQSASSHLLTHKSDRTKVKLSVAKSDTKKVKNLLPYLQQCHSGHDPESIPIITRFQIKFGMTKKEYNES